MFTKICSKCRQEKPANEFYKRKRSPDGLQSYCKTCMKESLTKTGRYRGIRRTRAAIKAWETRRQKYGDDGRRSKLEKLWGKDFI